jgi:hypothetical protein
MLSMKTVALSVFVWLAVGSFAFADVRLSFRDGRVSIVAKDATVGQILSEWAKIGQTKIVNVERIPRAPLTIELENMSEERALDVVLREVSGYIAAPRAIDVPNASRFDRIIVVPTSIVRPASAAPPAANISAPSAYQTPAYPPPRSAFVPPPPADDAANPPADDNANDEPPPPTVGVAIPTVDSRGPVPNTARQALEVVDPRKFRLEMQPQGGVGIVPPTRAVPPGGGVAVPGMIVQPTAKPR